MSIADVTRRGRAFAEAQMLDMVTVSRSTGDEDPLTGLPVLTPVYSGKAKVQTYEAQERAAEVGGGTTTVQRYNVHVPVGSFEPEVGDVVTVAAATLDPNLAGREFVVRALLHKTAATAYRLLVDDNDGFGGAA